MTGTFVRTRAAVLALLAKASAGPNKKKVADWLSSIDNAIAGTGTAAANTLTQLEDEVKAEKAKINRGKANARATRLGLRSIGIHPGGPYGERLVHTAYNKAVAKLGKRIGEILAAIQCGRDKAKRQALLDATVALLGAFGSTLPFEQQKILHELVIGLSEGLEVSPDREPEAPENGSSSGWASSMIASSSSSSGNNTPTTPVLT
jgi:hypothetical protein